MSSAMGKKNKQEPFVLVGNDKDSFKRLYDQFSEKFMEPFYSKLPQNRKPTKAEIDAAFDYALQYMVDANKK